MEKKVIKSSNSNSDASRSVGIVMGILRGAIGAGGARGAAGAVNSLNKCFETKAETGRKDQGKTLGPCPAAGCGTTLQYPSMVRFEGLTLDNEEDIFWRTFFSIIDSELEEKYSKQVQLEGPFITWNFWITTKTSSKSEQYREVLNKATFIIRDEPRDWEVDSVEKLLGLAGKVRDKRQRELHDDGSHTYAGHLDVSVWWNDLYTAIENLLQKLRSKTDRWCTVTEKKRNRRRN